MDIPAKLKDLMYGLMKGARRDSFMEFLEYWNISEDEYDEIEKWFFKELGIKL